MLKHNVLQISILNYICLISMILSTYIMPLCSIVTVIVPENSVSNLTAFWKDGVVEISWIPLSLFEAKGFPLYTISYTLDNGTMRIINTTNSSIVISGLEPKQSYTFTVQVTTGNGTNKDQIANGQLRG